MSEIIISDELYNNNSIKYSFHQNISSQNNKENYKAKPRLKKLKLNSISELEFLYNDSQNKITTKNKNTKIKKKNLVNYSSNDKNTSTDIVSTKNENYKNSRQYKQTKFKKSSQSSFDQFLNSIKKYEKKKENRINNLKTESIKRQISELRDYPKISKRSIILANAKERDALYLKKPLSEEKKLEGEFIKFYKNNLNLMNKIKTKEKEKGILTSEKRVREKFNKFYEDNIQWKKNKDETNRRIKYEYSKISEEKMNKKLTFRPCLTQNTIQIIKKLRNNKKNNLSQCNNLYNYENERELLDKLKMKLKPVLSEYFDINNMKRPYVSKRSLYLANNITDNNRRRELNKARSYQIINNKNRIIMKKNKENKINKKAQKEENKDDTISAYNVDNFNKYQYNRDKRHEYYLLKKFKDSKKKSHSKKKELYKLNIRENTAWNQELVNNVIPKRKYGYIIKGLL